MIYPLPIIIAAIPSFGMLSGLTASFTVTLLLVILAIKNKNNFNFNIQNFKLEAAFALWCFVCCFMTPQPQKSLVTFLEVFSLVALGLILKDNIILNNQNISRFKKAVFTGVTAAIFLFFIEYFSNGIMYQGFRSLFQSDSLNTYQLHSLDRGCALLAISSWILIGILLDNQKRLQALCVYVLVFVILYLSDSLASFIGFFLAGLLLIASRLSDKFFKFATIMTLMGSTLFPVAAHLIDPYKVSDEYSKILPDSAKHRLFIWHYVIEKSELKPFVGAGFAASRQHVTSDNEIVTYGNYRWNPLPLHPHSNVLQIIFETGAIGFILFLGLVFKNLNKIEALVKTNRNYGSASYACFVNYYIIGMISFSIWQTWWVASGIWVALMLGTLSKYSTLDAVIDTK
jgi:O-antigen ligase